MKGIVVAAGKGTRLGSECKGLLDVAGKPLVTYALDVLSRSGIKEVMIVEHADAIRGRLGDHYAGMKLFYTQQAERKGIAHAIGLAESFAQGQPTAIVLGDIVYSGDMNDMRSIFYASIDDLRPFDFVAGMMPVDDKTQIKASYGVVRPYEMGIGARFIEKPENVDGLPNLLGTGIYIGGSKIFDIFRKLKPSARGELEITDALNLGHTYPCEINGSYVNVNTQEDLWEAQCLAKR
jgi:glucose-1-phosphate thymidylyltransferase